MHRGEVGEVSKACRTVRVKWRIENFFLLLDEVDSSYESPQFYFLNTDWFLKMYPNGQTKNDTENWIELFLMRRSRGPPKCLNFAFTIRNVDGSDEYLCSTKCNNRFSEEDLGWGTSKFLNRSVLLSRKSQLLPSGALTFVCTMWSDELPSAEGGTILRKHLQEMLLDGEDHDVTLKVKDQEFRAHKCVLRARSKVFAAMFTHNMTENESGKVNIEDCDPNAFGEFLKYIYVGKVENMSPSTAMGLYYAADKYDFPDLKETCVDFLKASLTTNVLSDVFTLAMNHAEKLLLECAMEFFSKHLVETLKTVEWLRFIESDPRQSNKLTIEALETFRKSN